MITEITMSTLAEGLPAPDGFLRVLMFYGSTCGPCKATMPHYETASDFFESRGAAIKFFKMNAWEPEEHMKYCNEVWQLKGVPTFKVFYNGEVILDKVGGGDEETMKKFIHDGIDEVYKRSGEKL